MARILIVDDDDDFRTSLKEMVERSNHEVVEASGANQGIQLFKEKSFDLIISDIIMPEKDGLGLLAEWHKLEIKPKIIMISGGGAVLSTDQYLNLAHEFGADRILQKPFTRKAILGAVNELVGPANS